MKKCLGILLMLGFLAASNSAFAEGISTKEKVVGCVMNPIGCTKIAVIKTGRAVFGIGEKVYCTGDKVVRGAWGLTMGKICKAK